MNKFLMKCLIFVLLILSTLIILDIAVSKGLRKSEDMMLAEWNDIVSGNINADIIINGSSRAWVDVSPQILENRLNLSVYNIGLDGYPFYMEDMRYELFLKYNNKPKYLIQTLDVFSLSKRIGLYEVTQFFPYLNESIVRNKLKEYEGITLTELYIPFIRYIHYPAIVKKGYLEFFNKQHFTNNKYKGFQGQNREWDNSFDDFYNMHQKNGIVQNIDDNVIELFDKYLEKTILNNTNIILVYPPEYREVQKLYLNRKDIINIYKSMADKYHITFLDYSDNDISNEKKFFYNSQHLNLNGANKFSELLAKDIQNLISSNKQIIKSAN